MNISKQVWKEIEALLIKHEIPCTSHLTTHSVLKVDGTSTTKTQVTDRHIVINVTIPDYFDDL